MIRIKEEGKIEVMNERPQPLENINIKKLFYIGKQWDVDVELYYFNARWIDPETGRFITDDPIRDGLNWYAYCSNNPINAIDPTGLLEEDAHNPDYFTSWDDVVGEFNEAYTAELSAGFQVGLELSFGTYISGGFSVDLGTSRTEGHNSIISNKVTQGISGELNLWQFSGGKIEFGREAPEADLGDFLLNKQYRQHVSERVPVFTAPDPDIVTIAVAEGIGAKLDIHISESFDFATKIVGTVIHAIEGVVRNDEE